MAKIIDPDDLVRNTNVYIDPTVSPPKVGLVEAGSLSSDGVSLQALYSFCKEQWKSQSDLIKYPFPIVAITPEQFEFVDNWIPSGQTTIDLFRDAGFAVTSAGSSTEEYIGVITLGDVSDAQIYYSQVSGTTGATADVVLTGSVNQCVKVYGDADNGNFDYRDYFTIYAREWQKIYDQANHTDIGVVTFTYQAYRFPLANSNDLKIDDESTDAHVATASTHTNVDITYYTVGQPRPIGGVTYYFDRIIDGNSQPTQTIYEKIQYLLRQSLDIDEGAGTVSGKTAELLLSFVGDTLVTQTGVYIDNFAVADTNAIEFYETGGTLQTFPFVAAGDINFNDNLSNDTSGIYRMFFTSTSGGSDYGTSGAILVRSNDTDETLTDISFSATSNIISASTTLFTDYNINNMIEVAGGTNAGFWTITGKAGDNTYVEIEETLATEAEGSATDLYEIIGGNISGVSSVSFSYDYDNNTQRGNNTSGTTAPVTVVALGLGSAQYVKTTGTITRTNANILSLVAALERNYSNPA